MTTHSPFYIMGEGLSANYYCLDRCNRKNYIPHFHPNYEILFFYDVTGAFLVDDVEYQIQKNDLIIVKPTVAHNFIPQNGTKYDRMVINVLPSFLDKEVLVTASNKGVLFHFDEDATICKNFQKLREYGKIFSKKELEQLFRSVLNETLLLVSHDDDCENTFSNRGEDFNAKVIRYISQNLTTISSLEQIANALFVSTSTLYHAFRRTMKISIMHYVRNQKVMLAQSLIQSGVSSKKASKMSGFDDYTTFYRGYKAYFGYPPNDTPPKQTTVSSS